MNIPLLILISLLPVIAFSQRQDSLTILKAIDSSRKGSIEMNPSNAKNPYKPEILTSGFIDVVNNGQINASARFIRLYVGEPGKFAVPVSLYSGVSSNNFQNGQTMMAGRINEQLVTNFINPLSGLVNISVDGVIYLKKTPQKYTRAGILYHFGERVLTGQKLGPLTDPSTGKPVNFLNSFAVAGVYFQTGAWERNNFKNLGICWLALRFIGCYTSPSQIAEFLPAIKTNGAYYGYSIGWGVEINSLVNIKILYYKYTKPPETDYSLPIYQFSFNYSMK